MRTQQGRVEPVAHSDDQRLFHDSERQEEARLRFLESERGRDEAVAFARRTARLYRQAVVSGSPPAGDRAFRLRLMGSYCRLKRYLHSLGE